MTTCEEVQKLLEKSEIENTKYELKSSQIFEKNDWKDDIAKELVAFANRTDGKVVIGLQDDGTFDGNADYDVDKLKGDINNIIRDKISPMINYNFEFLECDEGDLSIISVEKKKDIPYAYIVKREGHEIKNRIYYIRTPHGKRLVSDKQLSYLFNEKKLSIIHPFSIALVFKRPDFLIPFEIELAPRVRYEFAVLYNKFYPKYKELEEKVSSKWDQFVIELIIYQLIYTILRDFQLTWDIEIIEPTESFSANRNTPKESFEIKDLPKPNEDSVLSKLSIGLDDIFEDIFIKKIYLPPNSKIEIDSNGVLKMYNDIYDFSIYYNRMTGGQGFFENHPQAGKFSSRSSESEEYQAMFKKYSSMKIQFFFEGRLNFPESELEYFDSYIRFMNTFKKLIDRDWNHEEFVKTMPNYMFFNLEERLKRIENIIKKKFE